MYTIVYTFSATMRFVKTKLKIFVAGTFDRFHLGHQFFLWTAVECSHELVVVVARDATVRRIKSQTPVHSETERLKRIVAENLPRTRVRLGREDGNFWKTLEEEMPDILLLGYDQRFDEVEAHRRFPDLKIERIAAFAPAFFKSSKFEYNAFRPSKKHK